jgi:hypothetical protein
MIRRNLLGQFYTVSILFWMLVIFFTIVRYFDFSSDWAEGPLLSDSALLTVQVSTFLLSVTVLVYTGHGQFISKAKKYPGFAVLLLFCIWFAVAMMYLVAFFDYLFEPEIDDFGAKQQLAIFCLGTAVFAGTWLYTLIKFPEYKDVEFIKDVIGREVDRVVYKPDLSCEQCGEGLKEIWEYCPNCGGMLMGDDSILVSPYEVIIEDEEETPLAPPKKKRRGLFGRRKKKEELKEELILDEEEEEEDEPELEEILEEDLPPDEDFIDDFIEEKPKEKKAPKVTRVSCDKCETLLEIRNPKRPLNVRCPTCKNIWLLEE